MLCGFPSTKVYVLTLLPSKEILEIRYIRNITNKIYAIKAKTRVICNLLSKFMNTSSYSFRVGYIFDYSYTTFLRA